MKKSLIFALFGTLFFNFTFAYTQSEVNSKVEQIEKIVKTVFSNPAYKKKYAPIFKSTFESCAKTCKDDITREASSIIGGKYYSNFGEEKIEMMLPSIKEEQKQDIVTKTDTINEQKQNVDIPLGIGSTVATSIAVPETIEVKRGETKTAHYRVEPYTTVVKWEVTGYPEGISESQKPLFYVKYKSNLLFDIVVDSNAFAGYYEVTAKSGDKSAKITVIVN